MLRSPQIWTNERRGPAAAQPYIDEQTLIYTSRRTRKGLGPLRGNHYAHLSYGQMVDALWAKKNLEKLEVKTATAFLVGSCLFTAGSLIYLGGGSAYTLIFMLGSITFLIGGYYQIWQTMKASIHFKKSALTFFGLAFLGTASAKLGTIFYNVDSISDWINPDIAAQTKQLLESDAYLAGSILFLFSGIIQYAEISHGRIFFVEKNHLAWWCCAAFVSGASLYCASAIHNFDHAKRLGGILTSPTDGMIACLVASILFVFMSLCLLAECSEDDIFEPKPRTNMDEHLKT